MNKRAREIIFWIMEKRDYQETCTINDLMDKFKVSERTIRYDLEGITDFLLENKQKPIQLCEHGVIELQKDTDAIRMLLGQNDFYSFKLSKEERMHMILYLIANTGEHVTLQQLADILFVSRSTIIHDVDDVRKSISEAGSGNRIPSQRSAYSGQGEQPPDYADASAAPAVCAAVSDFRI